ncbi:hypothetical protein MMC20_007134 [Loxospora ochrophaea]|nr:hypothetical protein [Loxospora ochrophaea]
MVFNTITVSAAVTPTVVKTYTSHYLNRKPRRQKPTAHISYDEGLHLIRQFLHYVSLHTVEDVQAFTSQWVPHPRWVKVDEVTISEESISKAAEAMITQLGHKGVDQVGGRTWWQWRREGSILKAEWIEMRADYNSRKKRGDKGNRVMLYVHGGAYFFGSVDEHRYQMQRHARKLKARVFARVAGDDEYDYIPANGFLQRPSAAWPPPNADDMQEIALHAVENVVQQQLPRKSTQAERDEATEEAVQGFSVDHDPSRLNARANPDNPAGLDGGGDRPGNTIPGPGHELSIMLDGDLVTIKDQIQMYATNQLIAHPLVSPVLQPSLGGLPPLLIQTGGGEVLRDEQIYLAHKAANPPKYPPGEIFLDQYPDAREIVKKWKPTNVQLQVWDDLCHVAPTLSFTRPAKFMYRSIAQFGAWALARAQKIEIEILDDDDVSIISSGSDTDSDSSEMTKSKDRKARDGSTPTDQVGKAGDLLPPFKNHMIRQRIDRHGAIYPLDPPSSLPGLQMPANEIGVIKPGPVSKWLTAKKQWEKKFAREKRRVQEQRAKEMAKGFQGFGNADVPPPSALAGRRGLNMPKEAKKGRSWGMSLWSLWGSSHDEKTIEREEKADKSPETVVVTDTDGPNDISTSGNAAKAKSRSRSRRRAVTDAGQASVEDEDINEDTPAAELLRRRDQQTNGSTSPDPNLLSPTSKPTNPRNSPTITFDDSDSAPKIDGQEVIADRASPSRPTAGGVAFPFKLGRGLDDEGVNASTVTLTSQAGVLMPTEEKRRVMSEGSEGGIAKGGKDSGVTSNGDNNSSEGAK